MKKTITLMILWMVAVTAAWAQKGLAIDKVFEGHIIPSEKMVETRVRGKDIAKYQLSFFRSIRFEATVAQAEEIAALMEKDESLKCVKSGGQKGSKDTQTIMVQLKPTSKGNRFVCMKVKRMKKDRCSVVIIYMEGALDSLEKLASILKT